MSVILPTYRGGQKLLDCLQTVLAQTTPPCEIIVVDSSDDDSPDRVRERFGDRLRLIHLPERHLPGDARNVGVEAASGDVVACIDDDCLADPRWLEELARPYERDPVPAWVAGAVWPADNDDPVARTDFWVAFNDLLTRYEGRVVLRRAMYNLSYRRDAFLALGGFPANTHNEDRLFNTAFQRKHGPPAVAPDALVLHRCPTDLDRVLARHTRNGVAFVWGRRRDERLPGAFGVRHRWATPLLPIAREGLFWYRMWRYLPREALRSLSHAWLIHRAFRTWYAGVLQGLAEEHTGDWQTGDWGVHDAGDATKRS